MQKLAPREEEIMLILWRLEKAFVKEIVEEFPEPKPHYNSISTMVRILEDKGFVGHRAFGRTHQYYPIITQDAYTNLEVEDVVGKYFDSSFSKMISHFAKKEKVSSGELEEILRMIKKREEK
ncbi:BlaI/MecI/CopY family transcriptional regulator [Lewinella sp. W8]|uniref:BlaI/MecI/CopY family transcriptional regulator n=1 Tax=Lewinella sp. W8 TaxID=2528208 RepID=UPI0010672744|nr:BlaI/MecI/CopY family transcriptional regulator [Lewinella sp. W8]MTB52041.1 BlaI/MecI/CopY family transcriptional regulator [Lewinella sp. W8]